MKKLFSVVLVIMLLAALAVPAFAAGGSVSLSASDTSLSRGDTFTVTASLSNTDAIALGTVKLQYDSSVFELTGGSCHVSGTSVSQVIPAQNVGTFMFSGDPQVVSGVLFTFEMRVKEDAAFGDFTISSTAAIGVDTGSPISSGSVTVSVVCSHSYGSWTQADDASHQQTCGICGDVKTESHGWDGGSVTTPATCKETGEMAYACTVCAATKTETIPVSTEHSYGAWTKADDSRHTHTCSVCEKVETAAHTWNEGTVTTPATCKESGEKTYSCTGCAAAKTETIPVSTEHSYGTWTKVDDSTHTHTCAVCEKVETTAHTWNSGTVTKPATCKESGEKTYTCTGCGVTRTEVIAVLTTHTYDHGCDTDCNVCGKTRTTEHDYSSSWSKGQTSHWHECTECGDEKDEENHIPGAAATETEPQTCTVCGYILQAALGHTHDYAGTWTTDEAGHWYACSGCEEKGGYADHDFENACDTDCSVCGYTRQITHPYGAEWESDEANHWHTCASCSLKSDEEAHVPGAAATATTAQTCTVCGYEIAPALGGEVTEPAAEGTEPTEPAGTDAPAKGRFPWWLILVAIIAAAGAAAVYINQKKKKA